MIYNFLNGQTHLPYYLNAHHTDLPICMHAAHTNAHAHTHMYAHTTPPQPYQYVHNCTHPCWHTFSMLGLHTCFFPLDRPQERPWGLIWETESTGALRLLFNFLNVLSAPYCQVLSPCNDDTAHSSVLQRSREISGPYSVLLGPIVSVFLCVF